MFKLNFESNILITDNWIVFRNEQRIQEDQFNKKLETERNKAVAEKISLQNELRKTNEQLTAKKTQAEYA